ncbi:MAG: alpha/beta hydrolase [Lachnospiraceae bacterium]|nr:alpha/beta hydrolase [Lachnospiraceae bacterium]
MKKKIKKFPKTLFVMIAVIAVCLTGLFVYNRIMLKKDAVLLKNHVGQMIEVDGHDMCVYSEGQGDHTIVFMSGWGEPSPIYDFKALYKQLSDDYKIVVIEKFGYGFSDDADGRRSFYTILRQDREALQKAGITGPFVLCPHSLSGVEAILWAQKYPDEVEAIVGLDMMVANANFQSKYKVLNDLAMDANGIAKKFGLFRFINPDKTGILTEEEKRTVTALCCKDTSNSTVRNEREIENIKEVSVAIYSTSLPTVPTIQYITEEDDENIWIVSAHKLADASKNGKVVKLDCDHSVHCYEYERIAKDIKDLISGLE